MDQFWQQFLNGVLSQRGPTALPYAEDMKWYIRQYLMHLIEAYPSLQPKTAAFTHNDGHTVNLLQADGTVPMSFQGVAYNIPVIVWLMESYPRHAPLLLVNPTRDMIIRRPHPFVSPNGAVSIPYLQSWVFPASNLVDQARNLSDVFAQDPPLYSQRKPSNPIPNPTLSFNPAYGSGRIMEDPAEVFKKNATNMLMENVNGDIREMKKVRECEMEGFFTTQVVLRKRDED